MVALVLGLTCIRHKSKFNLGPRIFTINMMVFDAIHAVVSFLVDYSVVNLYFLDFLQRIGGRRLAPTMRATVALIILGL